MNAAAEEADTQLNETDVFPQPGFGPSEFGRQLMTQPDAPSARNVLGVIQGGYVDVVLDEIGLTTAPFYDAEDSGPGYVLVPAPDSSSFVEVIEYVSRVGAGVAWDQDLPFLITYGNADGLAVSGNFTIFTSDTTGKIGMVTLYSLADLQNGNGHFNQVLGLPLVMHANVLIGGGGTSGVRLRVYYRIHSLPPP